MIKEATSSVFVFHRDSAGRWRTALVWHPRLESWMPPGGHVEKAECAAQTAVREVREETGLDVQLVSGPSMPVPAGFPHQAVCAPWWTIELRARADNHTAERHVHVDHVFLALTPVRESAGDQQHEVRWFDVAEAAAEPGVSEDSRLLARELFAAVAEMSVLA